MWLARPAIAPHVEGVEFESAARGLSIFLNALRARIALWILAGAALVAVYASAPARSMLVAIAVAVLGAVTGGAMLLGIVRHGLFPRPHHGRWLALLAAAAHAVALAAAVRALGQAPLSPAAVLLPELVAFAAACPLMASHARLAASLDAPDLRRRAWRACGLVAFTTLVVVGIGWRWAAIPGEWTRSALAAASALLVVLALAKVVGVSRFLVSYLRHMGEARFSESPAELRAWHRA